MNFLIVYVSVPMLWGIAILYTAAQRAVGKAQDIYCAGINEKYDVEELLDDDPTEEL